MRKILLFVLAHRNTFLFFLLQIFALVFIVRFHFYQRAAFFNSANNFGEIVHHNQTRITNYLNLDKQNKALQLQNLGLLKGKRDNIYGHDTMLWQSEINTENFDIVAAKIIYNTTNRPLNTFIIDKGKRDGLENGLGVATALGIAGKIINTYDKYSLCLSILNVKSAIVMPKIKELGNKSGTIEWMGSDPSSVKLKGVHKYEEIKLGYQIVTSGYSINFPENLPVGKIAKIAKQEGSMFDIDVALSANLKNDYYVYVFKHKFKTQLDSIILNNKTLE